MVVAELADQFFIPYMAPGGNLERLFLSGAFDSRPIFTLDLPETPKATYWSNEAHPSEQ